jgi:hypothetical protein
MERMVTFAAAAGAFTPVPTKEHFKPLHADGD